MISSITIRSMGRTVCILGSRVRSAKISLANIDPSGIYSFAIYSDLSQYELLTLYLETIFSCRFAMQCGTSPLIEGRAGADKMKALNDSQLWLSRRRHLSVR